MTSSSIAKFAFLICDPKDEDNPVIDSESIATELGCERLLNLVLSKPDKKGNPTPIHSKYLKFLKENYFNFCTTCNLYDFNKFKRDHFIFLYAFSNDANYGDLSSFEKNIIKKYGNIKFFPFYLSEEKAARLVLLTKFRESLMALYSAKTLSPNELESFNDFHDLLELEDSKIFSKVINFQTRNTKDLDYLVNYCNSECKTILTSGWI